MREDDATAVASPRTLNANVRVTLVFVFMLSASMSLMQRVLGHVVGDVNSDDSRDVTDVLTIKKWIRQDGSFNEQYDLDGDGDVDVDDMVVALQYWKSEPALE